MKTRIERLSESERAAIPEHVEKWIAIGLRAGQTDWESFDRYMPICYRKAGIPYPKNIVRVQSPMVGAHAAIIADTILFGGAVGVAVSDAVRDAVRGAVGVAVGDAVGDAVHGAVRVAVRGAVGVAVGDAVGDAVRGAVGVAVGVAVDGAVSGAVGVAVSDAVGDAVGDDWHYWLSGQFWVGGCWGGSPAVVAFFTDVCGLTLSADIMERASAYRQVCESVSYIWPNKKFVIVCARPVEINRDAEGRLNAENKKSIRYPDGWGLYSWHGITVPERLIMQPETYSADEMINEPNAEIRRAMFEKIGYQRVFEEMRPREIEKWNGYELYHIVTKPNEEDIRLLKCVCPSTGREYYNRVPPDVPDCLSALAWRFSVTPDDWQQAEHS